jgi:hypothetical protein
LHRKNKPAHFVVTPGNVIVAAAAVFIEEFKK